MCRCSSGGTNVCSAVHLVLWMRWHEIEESRIIKVTHRKRFNKILAQMVNLRDGEVQCSSVFCKELKSHYCDVAPTWLKILDIRVSASSLHQRKYLICHDLYFHHVYPLNWAELGWKEYDINVNMLLLFVLSDNIRTLLRWCRISFDSQRWYRLKVLPGRIILERKSVPRGFLWR